MNKFLELLQVILKNIQKLRKGNKLPSYKKPRELILEAFKNIDENSKLYDAHSLKAVREITAENAGISDRLFKRHGRWKSD